MPRSGQSPRAADPPIKTHQTARYCHAHHHRKIVSYHLRGNQLRSRLGICADNKRGRQGTGKKTPRVESSLMARLPAPRQVLGDRARDVEPVGREVPTASSDVRWKFRRWSWRALGKRRWQESCSVGKKEYYSFPPVG